MLAVLQQIIETVPLHFPIIFRSSISVYFQFNWSCRIELLGSFETFLAMAVVYLQCKAKCNRLQLGGFQQFEKRVTMGEPQGSIFQGLWSVQPTNEPARQIFPQSCAGVVLSFLQYITQMCLYTWYETRRGQEEGEVSWMESVEETHADGSVSCIV